MFSQNDAPLPRFTTCCHLADDLRSKEGGKIACGKSRFKTLSVGEDPARYHVARTVDDMMKAVGA